GEAHDVLAAIRGETAESIGEQQFLWFALRAARTAFGALALLRRYKGRRWCRWRFEPIHLGGQRTAIAGKHDPRRRLEQYLIVRGRGSGLPQENATRLVYERVRVASSDQVLQLLVQFFQIRSRMFVEEDQVHLQALEPPVRVG